MDDGSMKDGSMEDGVTAGDAGAEPERIFADAMEDAKAGRLDAAVETLERVDALAPGNPNVHWNLGVMRAQLGRHEGALASLDEFRRLSPGEWRALPHVVQSCQALGDVEGRDRAREELLALRRAGADPALAAEPRFCREHFRVGEWAVVAHETYEPSGQRRVFYEFYVGVPGGALAGVFSLGSYDTTTGIARELGNIGAEERLYHLDWNDRQGHSTHGFFQALPSYEETRAAVVAALEGGAVPIGADVGGASGASAATPAARSGPATRTPPPRPSPAPADATRVASRGKGGGGKSTGGLKAWLGRLFGRGGRER